MDRKEFLRRFLEEVWTAGDADAAEKYLAPSYAIYHDPGDPWQGQTLDLAGFKDRLVKSRAFAPDQVFTVREMIQEDDRIAVSWIWRGTHLGDLPGIPATGKRMNMSGLTIYYFEKDRLSGHWQIADRLSIYQQIRH